MYQRDRRGHDRELARTSRAPTRTPARPRTGLAREELVFERGDGRYLRPNIVNRCFTKSEEAADVPRIRFQDLRHTATMLMLARGEDPKLVQKRLRHDDISMTLGLYGHVIPSMGRDAVDRLAALIS